MGNNTSQKGKKARRKRRRQPKKSKDGYNSSEITKEKMINRTVLDEILRDGRLTNYIYHTGRDSKMVDQAIKNKIVKQTSKIKIRRKLAKTQEAIGKEKW